MPRQQLVGGICWTADPGRDACTNRLSGSPVQFKSLGGRRAGRQGLGDQGVGEAVSPVTGPQQPRVDSWFQHGGKLGRSML